MIAWSSAFRNSQTQLFQLRSQSVYCLRMLSDFILNLIGLFIAQRVQAAGEFHYFRIFSTNA